MSTKDPNKECVNRPTGIIIRFADLPPEITGVHSRRIVNDVPGHSLNKATEERGIYTLAEARIRLLVTENKPDKNLFREVHRRVQGVRDKAREEQDEAARRIQRIADDEAQKEGFDRPASSGPSSGPTG